LVNHAVEPAQIEPDRERALELAAAVPERQEAGDDALIVDGAVHFSADDEALALHGLLPDRA